MYSIRPAAIVVLALIALTPLFATGGSEAAEETPVAFNATGFPIVDEAVTFDVAVIRRVEVTRDYLEMRLFQEAQERTNIDVNWMYGPADNDQWAQRKSLMFAAGDLPDIFFGGNILSSSELARYGAQEGVLQPLTDAIEQYGTNIGSFFADYPTVEERMILSDGEIYGVPTVWNETRRLSSTSLVVNEEWLSQLGLGTPTTREEFRRYLEAVRTSDLDGDGDVTNEIPFAFTFGHSVGGVQPLIASFGVPTYAHAPWGTRVGQLVGYRDGELVFVPLLPEYREAISYLSDLFQDELVDPEAFTHTMNVYRAKQTEGLYGAFFDWSIRFEELVDDYGYAAPFPSADGSRLWPGGPSTGNNNSSFSVTNEVDPTLVPVAVRWADYFYQPRVSAEAAFGPNRIAWAGDGRYTFIPAPEGISETDWFYQDAPIAGVPGYISIEMANNLVPDESDWFLLEQHERAELYAPYFPSERIVWPTFTVVEEEELSPIASQLYQLVAEAVPNMIFRGDVETRYREFTDSLNQIGVDRYMERLNTIFTERGYLVQQ